MKVLYNLILIQIIFCLGFSAYSKGFSGNIKLGYFKSTGNVEIDRLNSETSFGFKGGGFDITAGASIDTQKNKGVKIQEEFNVYLLGEYRFVQKHGAYAKLSLHKNELMGIKSQNQAGLGYLTYWMERKNQYLKSRIGFKQSQSKYTDNTDETIYYALFGFMFKYGMGQGLMLKGKFDYTKQLADQGNKEMEYAMTVAYKLNRNMDLELKYRTLKVDKAYVIGKETTDTSVSSAIVYNF